MVDRGVCDRLERSVNNFERSVNNSQMTIEVAGEIRTGR